MNRRLRKTALVTAAITAGLLMTACQNGSTGKGSSADTSASTTATPQGSSKTSGTSGPSGSSGTAGNASKSQQGVNATITGGTVSYLAPGKYLVAVPGKTDRAFFVATDTQVHGAGTICGGSHCTLDQLETATRKAAVPADVTIRKGVATVVRERHGAGSGTGTKGVSGTWLGNVGYLAPGKFTVSDMKGVEQAFFVADSTKVYGAGTICGAPGSSGSSRCTLDQLEAAAKKGVSAKVVISGGVATTVTEDR
ncbi:hypothetical protein AB0N07_10580 [Streptomyces sp. NPDC051172]|uniref:hypothetical protein n=1 Tax=Streptomyces sp. NPDC051172 TaxID=3155796 RepID=UPI003442532F